MRAPKKHEPSKGEFLRRKRLPSTTKGIAFNTFKRFLCCYVNYLYYAFHFIPSFLPPLILFHHTSTLSILFFLYYFQGMINPTKEYMYTYNILGIRKVFIFSYSIIDLCLAPFRLMNVKPYTIKVFFLS